MSRRTLMELTQFTCFPRVSGDEPESVVTHADGHTFSPRERG